MLVCPSCGVENPEGAKFCNACGTVLGQPEQRRKERKFATALAEQEDPEVVQSVVGRTFDRLSEEIARYEGLLEKFMGDAVLAVFGVPRAHEDDAERAVRAALEMQAVLSELNRSFAAEARSESAAGTANARGLLMPSPAVPGDQASKRVHDHHEGFFMDPAA